jgi:hypothetical protein
VTGFSYLSFSKRRAKWRNPRIPGLCAEQAKRQCQKSGNRLPPDAAFLPLAVVARSAQIPVGASLLAKAACQAPTVLRTDRFREQARSHRGFVVFVENNSGIKTGGLEGLPFFVLPQTAYFAL